MLRSSVKPALCRAVIVFCTLPDGKGWSGGRPGVITKVWGDTPESCCNVSVTMDEGDAGHPQTTRLTSVRVYDAPPPGERDPSVVPTVGPNGESIWAEWPQRVPAAAADSQYQEALAGWKKDSEAWGGRLGELEHRVSDLERELPQTQKRFGGLDSERQDSIEALRAEFDDLKAKLSPPGPAATTAAADVPGEPVTSGGGGGGKGKKN